jgi:hypothetical protein
MRYEIFKLSLYKPNFMLQTSPCRKLIVIKFEPKMNWNAGMSGLRLNSVKLKQTRIIFLVYADKCKVSHIRINIPDVKSSAED